MLLVSTHSWSVHTPGQHTLLVSTRSCADSLGWHIHTHTLTVNTLIIGYPTLLLNAQSWFCTLIILVSLYVHSYFWLTHTLLLCTYSYHAFMLSPHSSEYCTLLGGTFSLFAHSISVQYLLAVTCICCLNLFCHKSRRCWGCTYVSVGLYSCEVNCFVCG